MLNPQKMKNLVVRKSRESKIAVQQMYGLYAMDRLVLKLSESDLADSLIVKGGFLLTTDLGVDMRATRDLDFTMRNLRLDEDTIDELAKVIEAKDENDNEYFVLNRVNETREDFAYNGYNLKLNYYNGTTRIPINVDVTSGEDIIPIQDKKLFQSIFTNEEYMLNSYPIEQVVSDKFYTLLAYGDIDDTNSRMKDYYDLYLITRIYEDLDLEKVNLSLEKTMDQRDNHIDIHDYEEIIDYLSGSEKQNILWSKYSEEEPYAGGIEFEEVMDQIHYLSNELVQQQLNKNREKRLKKNNDLEF